MQERALRVFSYILLFFLLLLLLSAVSRSKVAAVWKNGVFLESAFSLLIQFLSKGNCIGGSSLSKSMSKCMLVPCETVAVGRIEGKCFKDTYLDDEIAFRCVMHLDEKENM